MLIILKIYNPCYKFLQNKILFLHNFAINFKNKFVMNILTRTLTSVSLILILSHNIYSQQKFEPPKITIINQEFTPLLDSLIKPPSGCDEAWALVVPDSSNTDFVFNSLLESQDSRIQKLLGELNTDLNKTQLNREQVPSGNGPPQSGMPRGGIGPPGGMDIPLGFGDVHDDIEEVNKSVDEINVTTEKFKNELTAMQSKINEKLHKTHENDYDGHIAILNDFMKSALSIYEQYGPVFRRNMKNIDDLIKKYDYGTKVKMGMVKIEFVKLQMEEVNTLKFLLNITKEFTTVGAKFYNEKQKNLN